MVESASMVLRVGLSLVLVIAAVGKLLDLAGSRKAVSDFGVPGDLAFRVGTALPWLELLIAASLLPTASARFGAIAAAILFSVFVFAMVRVHRQGKAPNCHCFGQLQSEPVGRKTILRTSALALFSLAVAVVGSGDSIAQGTVPAWLIPALCFLLVFTGVAALHPRLMIRRYAKAMTTSSSDLAGGDLAPGLTLVSAAGEKAELVGQTGRTELSAVVFTSPGCSHCEELLPRVAQWQRTLADRLSIVVAHIGSRSEVQIAQNKYGSETDPIEMWAANDEAMQKFGLSGTPSALVIESATGKVVAPPVSGSPLVEALIRDVLRGRVGGSAAPSSVH